MRFATLLAAATFVKEFSITCKPGHCIRERFTPLLQRTDNLIQLFAVCRSVLSSQSSREGEMLLYVFELLRTGLRLQTHSVDAFIALI